MKKKLYEKFIKKCLSLARKGHGFVLPNPMVGAILVDEKGKEISSGYHQKYGAAHAEANCLKDVECDFSKTTLFVNLEPCSHFGKTPPCVDLILKRGIKKVVIGMLDPNPKVAGRGIKRLQAAGVDVVYPVLEKECEDLNRVFIKNITQKRAFVAIKTAVTLDGKIATDTNSSKWITGACARREAHKLRACYDSVMVGSNTVLIDNPSLTTRNTKGKNPARIVFDRSHKTNFNHKVYNNDGTRVILVTNAKVSAPSYIEIVPFKNFDSLFKKFYEMGIYSVMIEGGSGLNSAVIEAGEADYIHQFIAPKILGSGLDFVKGLDIAQIDDCCKLEIVSIKKCLPDILINAKFLPNI